MAKVWVVLSFSACARCVDMLHGPAAACLLLSMLIVFPSNPIKIYFLTFSFYSFKAVFLCLTLERKEVVTGPFPITAHKSSLYSDEHLTLLTSD